MGRSDHEAVKAGGATRLTIGSAHDGKHCGVYGARRTVELRPPLKGVCQAYYTAIGADQRSADFEKVCFSHLCSVSFLDIYVWTYLLIDLLLILLPQT